MKVLFLDFDGVLNSKQHFLMTKDCKVHDANNLNDADLFFMQRDVNKMNMWVLGYILDKIPDLKIVISSAWGNHYDLDQFKELFKIYKLDETRLIGITPRKMSSNRANEIHWWLDDNTAEQWIAVDDHVIFNIEDPDKKNEHLTDGWVGLTMCDAFKIIKHFKSDFEEPYLAI